jgi:predicted DNA-binding protein with PD1-like motif
MNYQIGKTGRVVVARLEDGEDVIGSLQKIASDEEIRAAVVYLIGGMKRGRFVVGPEEEKLPPRPLWRQLDESHEVVAIGTVFYEGDSPKVHLHGAFGKRDDARVGCLREQSEAFVVIEAVMMEIEDVLGRREPDPASGLSLLRL